MRLLWPRVERGEKWPSCVYCDCVSFLRRSPEESKRAVWLPGLQTECVKWANIMWNIYSVSHNKMSSLSLPSLQYKARCWRVPQSCQGNLASLIPIIRLINTPWQRDHEDVLRSSARARRHVSQLFSGMLKKTQHFSMVDSVDIKHAASGANKRKRKGNKLKATRYLVLLHYDGV